MERQLYYYEYVYKLASELMTALANPDQQIFKAATDSAVRETELFKDRLHVDVAGLDIGKDVVVELGASQDRGYGIFIPIKWHAANQASLFPSMEADLEITALSDRPPCTQIGILGRYRPPMGVFGALGDAMIGHRLAEASVRHFLSDLASRLNES